MRRFLLPFIPICLGVTAHAGAASQTTVFAIDAPTAKSPPKIDGTLGDPAWKSAAHVRLGWDFTFARAATEVTDAYVTVDSKYIYVAFQALQREPIVATQHANDQPLGSDDVVRVYFWPAGNTGNEYGFVANPSGTRYAFSTENTAFAPVWEAVAKSGQDGYVVTERIPLDVMRGDGRSIWRVQFDRRIRASNQVLEWAYDGAQGGTDSSNYAGYMHGMDVAARSARTKPRLAVYGLGEYASAASGGSTSRMGVDVALPVTQTSSFVATFHPDFSNVELDQQTISPTAFPRKYAEVRPFFTQGANYYNHFNCNDCLNWPLLYTPGIPTPSDGYALEGTQGTFTFGAFDAVGIDRNDAAAAVHWTTPDHHYEATYQRAAVDLPGVHDIADYVQGAVGNYHNFSTYVTLGNESGTQVTDQDAGRYREYGVNLYTPKSGIFAAYHDVGSQYAPYDAFNQINDVQGPSLYAYREYDNAPKSYVQNVTVSQDVAWYHNGAGSQNYAYTLSNVAINTRTQWTLQLSTGSTFLQFPNQPGGLTNQNGLYLAYGANTSTPTALTYNIGRFGPGYLHSTDLQSSIHLTRLGILSLEASNTQQALDSGGDYIQWLERASFAYQLGPGESVAAGWRRIIGTPPVFFTAPAPVNATNLTFAYYRRVLGWEVYLAYGDPNQVSTQHSVILKIIRYVGADKGT